MYRITASAHIKRNLSWNLRAFEFLIQIYRNKSCLAQH